MFVFHCKTVIDAITRMRPKSAAGLARIGEAWGTPQQQEVLDRVYPTLPKISVDYGMMEPAGSDKNISICTVPMNVEWLDVGSWPSYGETLSPDNKGNCSDTKSYTIDCNRTLAVSDDPTHTIAMIGCDDLVVIHTKDATLVFPASEAQRIKEMHGLVDPTLQ